jgi:hypothetical protein
VSLFTYGRKPNSYASKQYSLLNPVSGRSG